MGVQREAANGSHWQQRANFNNNSNNTNSNSNNEQLEKEEEEEEMEVEERNDLPTCGVEASRNGWQAVGAGHRQQTTNNQQPTTNNNQQATWRAIFCDCGVKIVKSN